MFRLQHDICRFMFTPNATLKVKPLQESPFRLIQLVC